jgi:hypothetical protein
MNMTGGGAGPRDIMKLDITENEKRIVEKELMETKIKQ